MKRYRIKRIFIITTILCALSTYAFADDEVSYYEFYDNFSSYTSAPYFDVNTALPYDGTAKVVATHSSGAEWRLSTVYYGRNLTTPAYMWIEAANKRLVLSSSQGYPQAINLDIKKEASTYEINKLSFDVVKNGYKSSGMSMFISSDEKTYYHIGLSGVEGTQYNVPKYTPFVAKVENGAFNSPVVLYYDSTQAWTASDVPAHFEVTVSGSTISWTVTGATSQTWSGAATDTYLSEKVWQYPCAAFANSSWGNNICAISNVIYKASNDFYLNNMGEPINVLYYDIADGQEIINNQLLFNDAHEMNDSSSKKNNWIVRKISCPNLSGQSITAQFCYDSQTFDEMNIQFDSNGNWVNLVSKNKYTAIKLPEGKDYTGIKVFTDVNDTNSIDVAQFSQTSLEARLGNILNGNFVWSSSNDKCASVQNGVITGLTEGSAVITAKSSNMEVKTNVRVIGELTYYEESGRLAEYLANKKLIINVLNNAITANDIDGVASFLQGSDKACTLAGIPAIDNTDIVALSVDKAKQLAKRIITYGTFDCNQKSDIFKLADVLENEFTVGKIDTLTDAKDFEAMLTSNNSIYLLPLSNTFYCDKKQDVLTQLISEIPFANLQDLQKKFADAYVMCNFSSALNAKFLQQLIADCANEIGYDTAAYNKISDKPKLAQYLLLNQSKINTITDLAEYINNYKEEDETIPSHAGNSAGSKGTGVRINVPASSVDLNNINIDSNTLSEKQVFFSDLGIDHWAYESVRYLKATNAISGYEDGTFKPDNNITRAEFLKILFLALKVDMTAAEEINDEFNDCNKDDWYCSYFAKAKEVGVIVGDDQNNCLPNNFISRQEAAVIVYRAIESLDKTLNRDSEVYPFSDGADIADWASSAVAKLQAAGVISGSNNHFMPRNPLTRAEAAKIIQKTVNSFETEESENG